MAKRDYYDILGIPRDSGLKDIKQAEAFLRKIEG
jgi:curved DNA-binding protein CbpA